MNKRYRLGEIEEAVAEMKSELTSRMILLRLMMTFR